MMQDRLKRLVDVLLAGVALVVTAPLWLLIALIIRLTSPGPSIYVGRRIGKDGKPFGIYKFRSMRAGADAQGPGITAGDDPRTTPVGRVLRATKLDELPQLLNVLRGDMSLVGPRPEDPRYVACYASRFERILSVRPGITGPTQLSFLAEEHLLRHGDVERVYREVILPVKLESDLRYVENRTLAGDLRYLAVTASHMVRRRTAGGMA